MAKRLPIRIAKDIAKEFGQTHVIILTHDEKEGLDHVVTYGKTVEQCDQAAEFGNRLKQQMGWPQNLCQSEPSRVAKLKQRIKELEDELAER